MSHFDQLVITFGLGAVTGTLITGALIRRSVTRSIDRAFDALQASLAGERLGLTRAELNRWMTRGDLPPRLRADSEPDQ